ncbi:MAG: PIN domain-containing protein [Caldilineaceae bacterium]|nr:PIN domain-containing protein [Caldilineaceae bacterium]
MKGSSEFQFVDTNVLVYAHDVSAGFKYEQAQALLGRLWESGNGCLSIQVLQEFYVVVTRKVAKPLHPDRVSPIINSLGKWSVHSPTVDDLQAAISLQSRYGISFWDAMIVRSAVRLGCLTLWSEDLNAGQRYENLVVANPFQSS